MRKTWHPRALELPEGSLIFLEPGLDFSEKLLVILGCLGLCRLSLGLLRTAAVILTHARLDVGWHDSYWIPSRCIVREGHLVLDVRDGMSQRWSARLSWDNRLCLFL